MTTEEKKRLTQIARDFHCGLVFSAVRLGKNPKDLVLCFMPLLFIDHEELKDVWEIYAYLHEAGPVAINGHPTFFTMRFIYNHEKDFFLQKLDAFAQAEALISSDIE